MAPSDKSDGTSAPPPWQRTAKDGGGDSEATVSTGIATEDVVYSEHEQDGSRVSEHEYPVSGSAAPRLFGAEQPPAGDVPPAGRTRPTPSALRRPGRGPRRASLQIKRFDPWSVLKLALVLGVALFFVWLVAVGVLYTVLDGMGVWDKLNGTYSSLVGGEGASAAADPLISAGRVFGIAAILGAINIVLISALATVSAFIYNVSADLAGGLEVTLSERE
ncbi:DUF3566 domain-containing protein [Amycolatopsis jiangsuensis]|uniref:DUF3566 domain-containing protein n=1 Tax=Amycolatopsis jiangsuensis TaxID=1181879 RepID=A0A840J0S2_9PSEU|nr:DUF3566 domain-containing protein [Amycolatopsis jiangsuensis]MBB4687235.1 hypothetical protein [Amycolatopsis jiangsuensis]